MRTPLISLVTLSAVSLALSACGQKGPLYLPQDPAAPAASATTSSGHSHGQPAGARSAEDPRKTETGQQSEQQTQQQTEQHTEAEAVSK